MTIQARKTRPAPLSIRLSAEERARLERDAAGLSLSAYIKERIFGVDAPRRLVRGKAPVRDHQALGQLLALLGASRLSSNLNQLARAAHVGALPVTPDTEAALQEACDEIASMRAMLMQGLGMRLWETEPVRSSTEQAFSEAVTSAAGSQL